MRCGVLLFLAACSSQQVAPTSTPAPDAAVPVAPLAVVDAGPVDAGVADAGEPAPSFEDVAKVLYVDTAKCPDRGIDCLFATRYAGDAKAVAAARSMLDRWTIVAGVERAYTMDGGYRGMIHIEPAVPVGAERKQLDWIVAAFDDIERFFKELDAHAAATTPATRYRWRPLTFRFFRSIAARTPSAYARDWTVAWNLNGSLHVSGDAVRETLVHEIFHLNDAAHPDRSGNAWSEKALGSIYDGIVKKCGTAILCLTPYSPAETIVRGGTYYPFQPGNDVREYAAELASRYVREQRTALRSLTPKLAPQGKPFKCGPSENQRAWSAIRDEFFSGIDATPPCP